MTRRIIDTSQGQPRIVDTSPNRQPRLDPAAVAAALGAELPGIPVEGSGPMALLSRAAQVGKRPAAPRETLTISADESKQLDDLAAGLATAGFTPTAGQVAVALIHLALRTLADPAADRGPLAAALAELVASERRSGGSTGAKGSTSADPAS